MDTVTLHILLRADAVLAAVLGGAFLLATAVLADPGKTAARIYRRINSRLVEQKGSLFDYHRVECFLLRNGAADHLGSWVEPVKYQALKIILALTGLMAGIRIHVLAALVLAAVAYAAPGIYLVSANSRDNQGMLPEIKLVYNSLAIQIQSGVYMADALSECYASVTDRRLKAALRELSGQIIMKSNFGGALEQFRSRFDNPYIDSLCVILLQAMETGQAVDLLSDISEQLKDMEAAILQKRKGKLDRDTTFYLLGIMAAVLGVVIYVCVSEIFRTAVNF